MGDEPSIQGDPQIQAQPQAEATPSTTPVPEVEPTQPSASNDQVSPSPEATQMPSPSADLSETNTQAQNQEISPRPNGSLEPQVSVNTEPAQQETENKPQESELPQSNTDPVQQNVSNQESNLSPSNPSPSSSPSIPSLAYPFYGSFSVSFAFGAQPDSEEIKKKYESWRLVGHNGIDFGLPEGTDVLACDEGTVIQAGDNGDFGISVTIQHSWGTSLYAHLKEVIVSVNQQVKKSEKIGTSGNTGFVTAAHLHFAIQPTNSDTNNGYLGFIDPTPYLTETITKPESQPPQQEQSPPPQAEPTQPPQEQQQTPPPVEQQAPEPPQPPDLSVPEPLQYPQSPLPTEALAKEGVSPPNPPVEETPPPPISYDIPNFNSGNQSQAETKPTQEQEKETPVSDPALGEQQAGAMFDARLKEHWKQYQPRGNQVKQETRQKHLDKIMAFAQEKRSVSNQDIRDLLHVSQTTATRYLAQLASSAMLKMEKKGNRTFYSWGLS